MRRRMRKKKTEKFHEENHPDKAFGRGGETLIVVTGREGRPQTCASEDEEQSRSGGEKRSMKNQKKVRSTDEERAPNRKRIDHRKDPV